MLPDQAAQKYLEEVNEILARLEQRKSAPAIEDKAKEIAQHEKEIERLRSEMAQQVRAAITKTIEELYKASARHEHHSDHAAAIAEATNRLERVIKINGTIPNRLTENYLKNYFKELKRKEDEENRLANRQRIIIF